MNNQRLLEALAVTAEVCGASLSEGAARIYLADLSRFPEDAVLAALVRVRQQAPGRLSLGLIIGCIEQPGSLAPAQVAQEAAEQWQQVTALVRGEPHPHLTAFAQSIVRQIGDYVRLENMGDGQNGTENRAFVRRDFMQAWCDFAKAHPAAYVQCVTQSLGFLPPSTGTVSALESRP